MPDTNLRRNPTQELGSFGAMTFPASAVRNASKKYWTQRHPNRHPRGAKAGFVVVDSGAAQDKSTTGYHIASPHQIAWTPFQYEHSHPYCPALSSVGHFISNVQYPPLPRCWASACHRHLYYYLLHPPQLLRSLVLPALDPHPHHLAVRSNILSLSFSDQASVYGTVCTVLVPRVIRRRWLQY